MRSKLGIALILLQLTAVSAFAQIQVKDKSVFSIESSGELISFPQIAFNTDTGESLVVWSGDKTYGRIVNQKGEPVTGQLNLNGDSATESSVAYNPMTKEYLLAYGTRPGSPHISITRLDAKARPIAPALDITKDAGLRDNTLPLVLFNPKKGGYVLIWFVHGVPRIGNDSFTAGVVLTETAAITGSIKNLGNPYDPERPILAVIDFKYVPSVRKFLFISRGGLGGITDVDYYLGTVKPRLKKVKAADMVKFNITQRPQNYTPEASISLLPDGSAMIFYTTGSGVNGQKIDQRGKLSGNSFKAFEAPKNNIPLRSPSAAFSTTSNGTRGILIATEEDEGLSGGATTWAQTLDENGKPIGSPVSIATFDDTEAIKNGVVTCQPGLPTDTRSSCVWYGAVARVPATGGAFANYILKLNLQLTSK